MIFNKNDMNPEYYYSWTAYGDDDSRITGKPDSTLFNRHEGYEVRYLVNNLIKCIDLENLSFAKKIEKLIHDELPSNIRSQENVKNWIKDNWFKYDL